jgi:hypothetical protein
MNQQDKWASRVTASLHNCLAETPETLQYERKKVGSGQPELHRIWHPAARFWEGKDIFAIGLVIVEGDWRIAKT